ncbi:MAG: CPBP family intramembrane metalloprotease [Bacteroidetes bacterium]|nr:CPBP family intramembrane metalloprotease [Bacteroidota bacterium]
MAPTQRAIHFTPAGQLGILLILIVVSTLVFTLIGLVSGSAVAGCNLVENMQNYDNPELVNGLKVMQIFNSIGLFIIPALLMPFFMKLSFRDALGFRKPEKRLVIAPVAIVMLVAIPVINALVALNENMVLPGFMSGFEDWMKQSEAEAARLTEAFLSVTTVGGWLFNLLVVAVIPAVGEELLFRGFLQRLFQDWTKRKHLGIWIAAILFSALHMQFYGFLPRMLMGALFGYIFLWTNSLWMPILAHFVNNALSATAYWMMSSGKLPESAETIGGRQGDIGLLLAGVALTAGVIFWIYKNRKMIPDYR